MNKVQYWNDQENLLREAGQMMSLVETDRHVKQAASSALTREMLSAHKPDKDHFLLHVIALGDHEHFGANRNGDSFPKKACIDYHPTFVSHGHYFREHRNRDPKQAIGVIKAACYNPDMGRVELAVWGHIKKAEDVLEKIKSGQAIGNSMSCRVPYDRSSITGKQARTPSEYDDYCKYRMGQYIPEHKKYAFVYNDHPTFFDISDVKNPADRIAYTLETEMAKAASTKASTGVDLAAAEGVMLPELSREASEQIMIEKLASLEKYLDAVATGNAGSDAQAQFTKHAAKLAFRGELSDGALEAMKTMAPAALFRKLASRHVVLPFLSFAAYATGRSVKEAAADPVVQSAQGHLPTIFTKLAGEGDCPELSSMCEAGDVLSAVEFGCGDLVDKALAEADRHFSTEPTRVKARVLVNACDDTTCEKCAAQPTADGTALARAYGYYQLSALKAIHAKHGQDTTDARNILVLNLNRRHV